MVGGIALIGIVQSAAPNIKSGCAQNGSAALLILERVPASVNGSSPAARWRSPR